MMTGQVKSLHVLIKIPVRLPTGGTQEIIFIMDTGFTGFLTLPPDVIAQFGLPFANWMLANLADGSTTRLAIHEAVIVWHGVETATDVLAIGEESLLGTALLDGSRVNIPFEEDGIVTIEQI